MPAVSSPSSSSSASAMTSGAPRSSASPYAGRRRRVSSLAADPALSSLGAIYVGWQAGERDPAPLCCPRLAKRSLVRKYGPDAVGGTAGRCGGASFQSGDDDFSGGERISTRSLSTSASPVLIQPCNKRTPVISVNNDDDDPAQRPTAIAPIGIVSFYLLRLRTNPPPSAFTSDSFFAPTPSETAAPPEFDPGEFLNTSLALFQSGGGAGSVNSSQPPSPTLVFPSLPPIAPPPSQQFAFVAEPFAPLALGKLDTVLEDDYDESLWSAGEDPLGSSAATDVTSEASWAW
ncbi:hypothetical protein B0A53_04587 [Rhodotorula sp. CCFEE 5036]|nr:hypothetical protein B0A53_04587 [Rhodotorula sp. CCFEE 5036]